MSIGFDALTGEPQSVHAIDNALMVSDSSSGFQGKRQFRAYLEFTTSAVLKLVFTKPFYLTHQKLWTGSGNCRAVISTGGVESGTFVPVSTKFCLYLLDGPVAGFTTAFTGGTVTVVNEREVLRSDSGNGGGSGNPDEQAGKRALPAGTYYISLQSGGTSPSGIYAVEWEEFK